MPIEIVSRQDFKKKVKDAAEDQLLIYYSDNADLRLVNRYSIIGLSVAHDLQKPIKVFGVNLDRVELLPEDKETYQLGANVICCTTINDGTVMEKQINPFETTLRQMVRNILV